ncbi:MAG: hypothetical protein LBC70_10565 [Chitinispirillales bacterium]|jgi:hypothetical protein|nr:hypothetical protein [Chitinispirillales bacterium]
MDVALCDVVRKDQLDEYYRQEGLVNTEDRIERLMAETGVRAMRGSNIEDGVTALAILEETVYLGHWRYFSNAR